MYIPCEIYYEKYLGDWCDNNCEHCFGDKEVYKCIQDFEVCGESIIHKVRINKGQWFWIHTENNTHVGLRDYSDKELWISKELFKKYFTDRFVADL